MRNYQFSVIDSLGDHSGDPVPIVISGPGIRRDKVEHYDEISCAEGAINHIKGREFVWTQLDYLEVVPKQGTKKQQNRLKKPGRRSCFFCV